MKALPRLSALLVAAALTGAVPAAALAAPSIVVEVAPTHAAAPAPAPAPASDADRYAARQAKDVAVSSFAGGGEVVVIAGSTLALVVLLVLLVILL